MHNKYTLPVTLNEVKGLKKDSSNDKRLCNFLNLLIYSYLDQNYGVKNFSMNDKCAAGTGKFMEVIAQILETTIDYETVIFCIF